MIPRQDYIFNKASKHQNHSLDRVLPKLYGFMSEADSAQFIIDTILEFVEVPQEDGVEHPIAEQFSRSKEKLLAHHQKISQDLAEVIDHLVSNSKNRMTDLIQKSIDHLTLTREENLKFFFNSNLYKRIKKLPQYLPDSKIQIYVNQIEEYSPDLEEDHKARVISLLRSINTIFKNSQENKIEKVITKDMIALKERLNSLDLTKDYKILNNIKSVTNNFNECVKQIREVASYLILLTQKEIDEEPKQAFSEQKAEPEQKEEEPVKLESIDSLKEKKEKGREVTVASVESVVSIPETISKPADFWIKNDKEIVVLSLIRSYQETLNIVDQLVSEKKQHGSKTEKARALKEQEKVLKEIIKLDVAQCTPEDLTYLNKKRELDNWFLTKKERPFRPLAEIKLPETQEEILYVLRGALSLKYSLSCKLAALKPFISNPPDKVKIDNLAFQEKRLGLISELYLLKLKATMTINQFKSFQARYKELLKGQVPPPNNIILPSTALSKNGHFKPKLGDEKKVGLEALIERKSALHIKVSKAESSSFNLVPNIARKKLEIEFIDEVLKNYVTGNNLNDVINKVIKSFEEQNKPIEFLDTSSTFLKNKTGKIVQSIRDGMNLAQYGR